MAKKREDRFYTVHVIEKSLMHHVIEWVATVLSAIGAVLNANIFNIQSFNAFNASFYVWFVANIFWISFAIKHKHFGVLVTFIVYSIINVLAILNNLNILHLF